MLATRIIETLKYFAIFKFPLTKLELLRYTSMACSERELEYSLAYLLDKRAIFENEGNYQIFPDDHLILRKKEGERRAHILQKKAKTVAKLIWKFPFVSGIAISGSLSKNFADLNSDLDFFIITAPHKLWVCRTILHVFKHMTFLFGKQHSFCMNYFIDESKLQIEEQNIFTAYELSTLICCEGVNQIKEIHEKNDWVWNQLPNAKRFVKYPQESKVPFIKKACEIILTITGIASLNKPLMRLTDYKWRRKWTKQGYNMDDYDLAFKTNEFVSKNHPKNYQKIVLEKLKVIT